MATGNEIWGSLRSTGTLDGTSSISYKMEADIRNHDWHEHGICADIVAAQVMSWCQHRNKIGK
eukprot:294420-Lingulodinium_polyedra.AAC.1